MDSFQVRFDPTGCQAAIGIIQLDYISDQDDAEKRIKEGQESDFCKTCDRWRWPDQRCKDFALGKSNFSDDLASGCEINRAN